MARERWGGRFGFVMATAGFAVGLGNIWRFPYVTGENGGAAFLIVYLAFAILIGIPLMTAEISLGRKCQRSPIAGMMKLTGKAVSPWNLVGWSGVLTALLIQAYYVMLIGWVMGYFVMILTGQAPGGSQEQIQAGYDRFIGRPLPVLGYVLLLMGGLTVLVASGLTRGVERVAKLAMPALFIILLLLMVRSLTLPGAGGGLVWYLRPDFSKLNAEALKVALGQAFYSIGIGMAAAFAFGSYLNPKESDVPGNAALVVAADTGVAFIVGLVIFPALFAFGIAPDSGPSLLFVTMPNLFEQMPAGQLFGGAFFLLLTLAGATSAIALFEALSTTVSDSFHVERRTAAVVAGTGIFALSVPIVLSQGPWNHIQVAGRDLFGIVDYVTGSYMVAIGGLLTALYVAISWGWQSFRDETNVGSGPVKINVTWMPFVRFIIPIAVALVLLGGAGIL
jgi:NSS family neurotransmitter:Na+ symporter